MLLLKNNSIYLNAETQRVLPNSSNCKSKQKFRALVITNNILSYLYFHILFEST